MQVHGVWFEWGGDKMMYSTRKLRKDIKKNRII